MYVNFFVLVLVIGGAFYFGTWAGTKYGYSVRHHIDLLWKHNHKLASAIGKARQDKNETLANTMEELYKPIMEKNGELIDTLLLHYFDLQNEEDEEYIRQHKYSDVFPPIVNKHKK